MKNLIRIAAMLLLAAVSSDCEEKETNPCFCFGTEKEEIMSVPERTAWLFNDFVPSDIQAELNKAEGAIWIIQGTDGARLISHSAIFYPQLQHEKYHIGICNYPDAAKKWDIPQEGREIYFSGTLYEACVVPAELYTGYYNLLLTNLKLK